MVWSVAALLTGFIVDAMVGDPYNLPHIVRWLGGLIAALEKRLSPTIFGGIWLVLLVVMVCLIIPSLALSLSYRFAPFWGYIIESCLCWQLLAAKSLKIESMKVYYCLQEKDSEGAKKNLAMIVGRDTDKLDKNGIIRATVETIAENTADGVVAPLLSIMVGGAPLGCLYKAVNTMDSMVGYKNDAYLQFGRAAAKTDDLLNYIPSRLSAILMVAAAFLLGFDSKEAFRIWRRDRRQHPSPNSAQTEAACAGALGIQLAGPSWYRGQLSDRPYIGDQRRPLTEADIINANRLMDLTSGLMLIVALSVRLVMIGVMIDAAL
ncbi:MAG TPA: adenosylcobinamide-phosphate synthase CbiB [bacterium]|nr:adenosylcobinamide-phosphate synthase CbiB [bacterium]